MQVPIKVTKCVIELILGGWQTDFPVVADGRVVGILTRADLLTAIAGRGSQAHVAVDPIGARRTP